MGNKGVFELCGENCPALKDKCSKTRHYCAKGKREIHVKEFCPATCGIVTTPPPVHEETPCVDKNAEVQKLCGQQCPDLKSRCDNSRHYCKLSRKEVNVAEFCPKTCGKFCGTGGNNKFAFDVCGKSCHLLKDKCFTGQKYYCAKGKRDVIVKEMCPVTCSSAKDGPSNSGPSKSGPGAGPSKKSSAKDGPSKKI